MCVEWRLMRHIIVVVQQLRSHSAPQASIATWLLLLPLCSSERVSRKLQIKNKTIWRGRLRSLQCGSLQSNYQIWTWQSAHSQGPTVWEPTVQCGSQVAIDACGAEWLRSCCTTTIICLIRRHSTHIYYHYTTTQKWSKVINRVIWVTITHAHSNTWHI
jgi:hypothetical protein